MIEQAKAMPGHLLGTNANNIRKDTLLEKLSFPACHPI